MARLRTGPVSLRKEWQPVEEVVGASLKLLGSALEGHPVRVLGLPICRCLNSMPY
jgi:two-component system sensor histidine kinase KdpD